MGSRINNTMVGLFLAIIVIGFLLFENSQSLTIDTGLSQEIDQSSTSINKLASDSSKSSLTAEEEEKAEYVKQVYSSLDTKDYNNIAVISMQRKSSDQFAKAMYYYACAKMAYDEKDIEMASYYLKDIPEESLPKLYGDFQIEYKKMKADIYKKDKVESKKKGVTVGMSKEEVLLSSWGKPEDINRTITEGNVSEQWVYSNNNYLYFNNGVLAGIQN